MALDNKNVKPMVINTWAFEKANAAALDVLKKGGSALDAIEAGCSQAEEDISIQSVGRGGSPDESGETTLDALIFDGPSHKAGAVGDLRRIPHAISVARKVLEHTKLTLLVGDQATKFAVQMGFKEQSLTTNRSREMWEQWRTNKCQPNFWMNVKPDPKTSCGPYKPLPNAYPHEINQTSSLVDENNHDTIGIVVIDNKGHMAVGTSTNGLKFKIPGRVGDSPIPGAGAYVDQNVGGAAATGDGDIILRFLPTYQAVESLRHGLSPMKAAEDAIRRIADKYPNNEVALVVASINGDYGAACYGFGEFPFSVSNIDSTNVTVKK
ncbi:putative N(4)-(beta-N-acetylglucosaminyl)-L-asparaginase-like protein, partial [Dinothrombium tinctorium]